MALWSRVQRLDGEALRQIGLVYNEHFPIDVRCALAHWIEEQHWNEIDPDNPQHEGYAHQLCSALCSQLETKISNVEFLARVKLSEAVTEFRNKYMNNPQQLVRVIKHCLNTEMRIVQQAEEYAMHRMPDSVMMNPDPVQQINMQLEKLRHQTNDTAEKVRQMVQWQEALVIQYQELTKRQNALQQGSVVNVELANKMQKEKEMYDNLVRQKVQEIVALRSNVLEHHQNTYMELAELQKNILDTELIRWKRGQQLNGNGVHFENNLDQIQEWCEQLADLIWQNRTQIREVERLVNHIQLNSALVLEKCNILNGQITSLLSSLVTSTFIIEKQPPQVMKTNTRFTATVRLLVGSKLSVHMTPPSVKVTIISENQSIGLLKNDKVGPGEASGEILNNQGTMEYHQATRQLSVSFRNMQLRKIKRAEKKGTESVMDEKFSLLFQSTFKVGGGELVFQVWTLSLPVVVIVHGNQEPHAWATITWDNAFAEPIMLAKAVVSVAGLGVHCYVHKGRVPFQVPEKVSWKEVADVLSTKFMAATGRGLSEENLQFLACKVFRTSQYTDAVNSSMVSWSQFCKEPLPDRSFTFWEWIYAILKITREQLRSLWAEGFIIGFIGRQQAEEMLLKRVIGTFLIRFSDSEIGGVTIAWVTDSQTREGHEVLMIQPFTTRDFAIRSLADRINDLKNLLYLYPDISKDTAFGKYYSPSESQAQSANGYVKPVLVTQIPGLEGGYGYNSYPGTPQSSILQSPDPGYHDPHGSEMQTGSQLAEVDLELLSMEFAPEMDEPVDFSSINVCDLVSYTQQS